MLIHNALDKVFDHKIKTGILRILYRESAGLTGRQLSRMIGASPTTVNKFLARLKEDGVIQSASVGMAYVYHLNKESYVTRTIVIPFLEKERSILPALLGLIKKAISRSKVDIETAALFGSVALKREGPKSDVDLVVILKNIKDKEALESAFDGISGIIARNFQTAIVPYMLTAKQFSKEHADGVPIIKEILSAYILVKGRPLERLTI